jgi:hypothetical protein
VDLNMFKLGDIIPNYSAKCIDYYIVVETGNNPKLELLDDYIMRCRTVPYEGEYCSLREIVEREKQRMISRGRINV